MSKQTEIEEAPAAAPERARALRVVRPRETLHVPDWMRVANRVWLREGGVVDVGDPAVAELVRGQEYKLDPAPADALVSPFPNVLQPWLQKHSSRRQPQPKPPVKDQAVARATTRGSASRIQRPDV